MLKIIKNIPLWAKIILGMLIGLVWGFIATSTGLEQFTVDWIKPWGTIFIKLLKLTAIPLIIVSLINGITSITDISKLSRIGLKTLSIYIATTVLSILIGLTIVNVFKPGDSFPEDKKREYNRVYLSNVAEKESEALNVQDRGPLSAIVDIVPDNFFSAASDNSKMLQVIFFSILFAISLTLLKGEGISAVKGIVSELNDVIFRIVGFVISFSPLGVFALLAGLIVDTSGDIQLFVALGKYVLITLAGLFFLILVQYPLIIRIFTRVKPGRFLKAILPAQMLAFSTSSSAAALPVTMKQCTEKLRISPGVANFVLPVGATINMDGGSFYQAVSAVFIAQVFGMDLSVGQQLNIVVVATLSSIGAPAIPGAGIIMLIIVLTSVGIPAEGLALILGIDRPLDMVRTAVNVTGDTAVATLIATSENEIDLEDSNGSENINT
ncbi:MAG: dicarboxylate/amino acid:cation symporter [Marinilabiliaceae bacterium]|jgi:Na+/H+-dicarboxylate symporter|nr:dicarboxylate/amino acid:cation symporter [Marinilabiliaceae bacterium]